VTVSGCEIHHTSAEAVDMERSSTSHDFVIDGNRIHDIATNCRAAVNVAEGDTGSERGYVIRNNRIWNVSGVRYVSDGDGIRIFTDDVYVYNNVMYGCAYAGIVDDEEYRGGTNYIYNNTCWGNGGAGNRNIVIEPAKSTQQVKNNIGYDGGTANIAASDGIFIDAAGGDFRLKSTAAGAIDKGVIIDQFDYDIEGDNRPAGTAWDIGAYEYQATTGVCPRRSTSISLLAPRLRIIQRGIAVVREGGLCGPTCSLIDGRSMPVVTAR